jgi:hypothetical protein
MMTDFTTWTHYFKWDSEHEANGIDRQNTVGLTDDGTLASELEEQFRTLQEIVRTLNEIVLVNVIGEELELEMDDDTFVVKAKEKRGRGRPKNVEKYGLKKDGTAKKKPGRKKTR